MEMVKPRLLILIVAYNAEKNIEDVLLRVPRELSHRCDTEVLVLDDSSADATFDISTRIQQSGRIPFPVHVLFNPINQGYGGNQKLGYHFGIKHRFDYVALLHGDGQYAPECLPTLLDPFLEDGVAAVFGSRMLTKGGARRGGMPLYKWTGNRMLSWAQNKLLRTELSEFHSGYRIYSVEALRSIPFDLNTNDFHFDTEIIVQLVFWGMRIVEVPIPTYYGDEICRVNGIRYAADVIRTVVVARMQEGGLFYDRKFDAARSPRYKSKVDFSSPHRAAVQTVRRGARVLDLGCAEGYVSAALRKQKECTVVGVDRAAPLARDAVDEFIAHDLNEGVPAFDLSKYDYILLLDVLEHLSSPEPFVAQLRDALTLSRRTTILVSTGNIGFVVNRLMLLLGQFNYGKRGILDITHTRLFTFASFRRLFEQSGFRIREARGIPAPFRLVWGNGALARAAFALNEALIAVARGLFSYQIFLVVEPLPSLEYLLDEAHSESARRAGTGKSAWQRVE
jgi:glycosyltransferase involved in cell wall biosynthesis